VYREADRSEIKTAGVVSDSPAVYQDFYLPTTAAPVTASNFQETDFSDYLKTSPSLLEEYQKGLPVELRECLETAGSLDVPENSDEVCYPVEQSQRAVRQSGDANLPRRPEAGWEISHDRKRRVVSNSKIPSTVAATTATAAASGMNVATAVLTNVNEQSIHGAVEELMFERDCAAGVYMDLSEKSPSVFDEYVARRHDGVEKLSLTGGIAAIVAPDKPHRLFDGDVSADKLPGVFAEEVLGADVEGRRQREGERDGEEFEGAREGEEELRSRGRDEEGEKPAAQESPPGFSPSTQGLVSPGGKKRVRISDSTSVRVFEDVSEEEAREHDEEGGDHYVGRPGEMVRAGGVGYGSPRQYGKGGSGSYYYQFHYDTPTGPRQYGGGGGGQKGCGGGRGGGGSGGHSAKAKRQLRFSDEDDANYSPRKSSSSSGYSTGSSKASSSREYYYDDGEEYRGGSAGEYYREYTEKIVTLDDLTFPETVPAAPAEKR
jgi:hypothetical protein